MFTDRSEHDDLNICRIYRKCLAADGTYITGTVLKISVEFGVGG